MEDPTGTITIDFKRSQEDVNNFSFQVSVDGAMLQIEAVAATAEALVQFIDEVDARDKHSLAQTVSDRIMGAYPKQELAEENDE